MRITLVFYTCETIAENRWDWHQSERRNSYASCWWSRSVTSTLVFYFIVLHLTIWEWALWSWLWSYDSWIYSYLCNQYLSPLMLWVRILLRRGVLDTTLCDKGCQWLATGQWVSTGTLVSSIYKTDRYNNFEIVEIY